MFINRNIKTIRKLSGLTQAQFAERVGINLASLKNYENTAVCPKLPAVLAICQFAGIEPERLTSSEISPSGINFCLNVDPCDGPGNDQEEQDLNINENETGEEPAYSHDLLKVLQSNDAFFKHQYAAFNVQVLANLSLLIDQSKKLETLVKLNLSHVQNIENSQSVRPVRLMNRRTSKAQ